MLIVVTLRRNSLRIHTSMVKELNFLKYSNQQVLSVQRRSTDLRRVLKLLLQSLQTELTTPTQASQDQTWFIGMAIPSPLLLIPQSQTPLIQELTCSKIGLHSLQTLPIYSMPMEQSVSTKSTKVEWDLVIGWHQPQL